MVRGYVPVYGLRPALMRRPLALPLTNDIYHTRRDKYIAIYIIQVMRHNVLLHVPTTLCRCTTRRSMVGDYVPVQVSSPAPTRRPAARPSLSIHIVHVVGHDVLLYVAKTLRRSTKKAVDGLGLSVGVDLVAGDHESALGPSLANDTYHTRREDYSDKYHTRRETQCTTVRTNNAVPVH